MIIKMVRHGESMANSKEVLTREVGDHKVALSKHGHEQARELGRKLGAEFLASSLIYCSPYLRARQTLEGIVDGSGLRSTARGAQSIFEDPRLREVDTGYASLPEQEEMREKHGWFFYRFAGGESPADCYDRLSNFLSSMIRQVSRAERAKLRLCPDGHLFSAFTWPVRAVRWLAGTGKPNVLIVSHGLAIRCLTMRFLHLSTEHFNRMRNPRNCDVITIAPKAQIAEPDFASGSWAVQGLRLRAPEPPSISVLPRLP